MITKAYACYNLNSKERANSSSGGIYPLIAREIIDCNGVIYAACYDKKLNVIHKRINNIDGIQESQGSKYVESSLFNTFNEVISDLDNGRKVLFIGTPCQCAGLSSLLRIQNINRSSITLIDFVCHGIPGRVSWDSYKKSIETDNRKLTYVNMRDKSTGWTNGNYAWREEFSNGNTRIIPQRNVTYMKGMLANLYLRPSCFECKFKGIDRDTDITLGDYWGVWTHLPKMDDNKGTSLVMVHTENGEHLFEKVRNQIKIDDADIKQAIAGNICIVDSTNYNPKREEFFRRLNNGEDFTTVVNDLTKASFSSKVKNKVKRTLKHLSHFGGGGNV